MWCSDVRARRRSSPVGRSWECGWGLWRVGTTAALPFTAGGGVDDSEGRKDRIRGADGSLGKSVAAGFWIQCWPRITTGCFSSSSESSSDDGGDDLASLAVSSMSCVRFSYPSSTQLSRYPVRSPTVRIRLSSEKAMRMIVLS